MLQHRLNPCVNLAFVLAGQYLKFRNSGRDDQPYIPPTKPYELSQLVTDLVLFARYMLKPGGRLVFFLPTVTDEYEEIDIYTMLCEGMEVIANSLQDFGSWGRRVSVITRYYTSICRPLMFSCIASDYQESYSNATSGTDIRSNPSSR
jgi:tRNA (guanine10-N2)-methyltransferase